ncbi:dithiol-disulfide isomerase [Bacillus cereus]|nr:MULTISPECIES: dithiol-disulfide isomerase [Bacillus]PFE00303.1 dithiol-disulfide isomerase [Bacillus sp. AFS023182]PGX94489.1 dithiol-disulfide isomerase [Bacillus cereus]WIY62370.1 dithiol-disulfide isomerase [Bacillus arachidis]
MTPINAVIPITRAATMAKSIKKATIWNSSFCLSVTLLYEKKERKERKVRK